jgi:hypothetical protein
MRKRFFYIAPIIFFAVDAVCLTSRQIPIILGRDTVHLEIYENNYIKGDRVFVHVHENEVASLAAGMKFIESHGGKLVTIRHSKKGVNRNITFNHKGETYYFDPNRIYTQNTDVLSRSLKIDKINQVHFKEALNHVQVLSRSIWDEVKDASYIISLHNNKNECATCVKKGWFGFRFTEASYSINSYVKTCDKESESSQSASEIYINPSLNNSEFFIVTQKRDFDFFLKNKMNVVLQNDNPIDDGSMSVWAVKNNVRYMNAEAKHGKVSDQVKMLSLINQIEK